MGFWDKWHKDNDTGGCTDDRVAVTRAGQRAGRRVAAHIADRENDQATINRVAIEEVGRLAARNRAERVARRTKRSRRA